MRCTTCVHLNGKGSPHRALGLFNCKALPVWTFVSPFRERDCKHFAEVPADQLQARLDWEARAREGIPT